MFSNTLSLIVEIAEGLCLFGVLALIVWFILDIYEEKIIEYEWKKHQKER